ncbi:MAG: hypothetical protein NTY66_03585 [Candidatus Vogelbacteria bacterium]|nr:hypothetical protein [Candidatus Vogelbacteria bacterium]
MTKKKLYWLVGVLLLIAIGWRGLIIYRNADILKRLQTGGEKALTAQEFYKLPAILAKAYRADTYGSTTPEGTLALFIDALKKGDADLAAKYFVVEKQPEYKKAVENWTRLGKNTEIANTYERAENGKEIMPGSYIMSVYETDGINFQVEFLKNSFTGLWKLQSI